MPTGWLLSKVSIEQTIDGLPGRLQHKRRKMQQFCRKFKNVSFPLEAAEKSLFAFAPFLDMKSCFQSITFWCRSISEALAKPTCCQTTIPLLTNNILPSGPYRRRSAVLFSLLDNSIHISFAQLTSRISQQQIWLFLRL